MDELPDTSATSERSPGTTKPESVGSVAGRRRALGPRIALVAAAYVVLGLAGNLLAPLPGHAAPLWPAAGLALAALLVNGRRCWPGVWLGAFIVNLLVNPTTAGAAVAALIAAGATLQARLGFALTRRWFTTTTPLAQPGDVWRFLLLGGPLACLTAATVGVAAQWGLGQLAAADVPGQWLVWWVGDSLGVLLFAPVALLVWPGTTSTLRPWLRASAALPLLVTAALLGTGSILLARLQDSRAHETANRLMEEAHDIGFAKLPAVIDPLSSVERFIAASGLITPESFALFTAHAVRSAEITEIDWLPRVPHAARAAFERATASQLGRAYGFTEGGSDGRLVPAAQRAEYFPVLYTEPMVHNAVILGLDHAYAAERRSAMDGARDTNRPVATRVMPLARTARASLLVFVPVYGQGFVADTASVESRRAALRGFVVGVFDRDLLFAPLQRLAHAHQLAYRVSDVSPGQAVRALAGALPAGAAPAWRREIQFGGQVWRLEMQSVGAAGLKDTTLETRAYLAFSLLAAFLIAWIAMDRARHIAVIEIEVAQRTAQLERELEARHAAETSLRASEAHYRRFIELSPYGVFVHQDGLFTYLNPMALQMFGASAEAQLLGQPVRDRLHPDSRAALREPARLLREQGLPVSAREMQWLRLDGTVFHGEASAVPYDYEGSAAALVLLQDITARKEAEGLIDRFFTLSLDMLCIAGANGYFRRISPAFTQTLGWSVEEMMARPFIDFVHPDDQAKTLSEIERHFLNGENIDNENRYRHKDGSWRTLAWRSVAQPGGIMYAVARDVTQEHETAAQIRQLNAELERRVEERTAELEFQKSFLRRVIDQNSSFIYAKDGDGRFVLANEAVAQAYGTSVKALIGKRDADLNPNAEAGAHGRADDWATFRFDDDNRIAGERQIIDACGRMRWLYTVKRSILAPDGCSMVVLGVAIDITERKLAEEQVRTLNADLERRVEERTLALQATNRQLEQARTDAEQANRAKSAFLAAMSHEIRTPMNGVLGMIEVLAQSRLTQGQADAVKTIRESASTLLRLIDDVLDFSKIEAGRLEIDQAEISVPDLVEGICSSLAPAAAGKGVHLAVFVAPQVPERLWVDPTRLGQVLYNLVGNAIKFSSGQPERRSGDVRIRVEAVRTEATAPLQLIFTVVDNGIGMAPETVAQLFTPFSQAETSTTRRFGGTGLGLVICKRLVELMGGEIALTSSAGSGTTVTVTLPFKVADTQPAAPRPELSGLDCIVIESPVLSSADMQVYLEHAGARVQRAVDTKAATQAASRLQAPVVVIHDAGSRVISMEVLHAAFAAAPGARHLLLARGQRRRARVGGPDAVTVDSNGLRRQTLLKAVAVAAGRIPLEVFHDSAWSGLPPQEVVAPTIAQARAQGRLILVAEDDPINQKVILQQLALLGHAAEFASNGAQALAMWVGGNYALLLTDLHMPEMDGYSLAQEIRRAESLQASTARPRARLPIVALTANALRGEANRARAFGIDEFLVKPVLMTLLKTTLEQWLPRDSDAAPQTARSEAQPSHAAVLDVAVLRAIVGNDAAVVCDFLLAYRDSALALAADLRLAADTDDALAVASAAHKLTSAARSVGALALGSCCAALEDAARFGSANAVAQLVPAFESAMAAVEAALADLLDAP